MNMQNYNDSELLEILRNGERTSRQAFEELYKRYSRIIHAYIFTLVKDKTACEDIFQDIFIKFYNYALKNEIKNIQGFLISSSRNQCLNYIRNKRKTVEIDEDSLIEYEYNILEKNELIELILSSLELLDDIYKNCFIMRELDGMSYMEIGNVLGITTDNAKVRTLRARRKIIELLQPYLKDLSK